MSEPNFVHGKLRFKDRKKKKLRKNPSSRYERTPPTLESMTNFSLNGKHKNELTSGQSRITLNSVHERDTHNAQYRSITIKIKKTTRVHLHGSCHTGSIINDVVHVVRVYDNNRNIIHVEENEIKTVLTCFSFSSFFFSPLLNRHKIHSSNDNDVFATAHRRNEKKKNTIIKKKKKTHRTNEP